MADLRLSDGTVLRDVREAIPDWDKPLDWDALNAARVIVLWLREFAMDLACPCGGNERLPGYPACEDCLIANGVIPDPKDLVCRYCGDAEPCYRRSCIDAGRYESRMP